MSSYIEVAHDLLHNKLRHSFLNREFFMEVTEQQMKSFLMAKAKEMWEQYQQPYLLSAAGPDMIKEGIIYKNILPVGEGIKSFVIRTSDAGGYRIVQHPEFKAKIGIVPSDASFNFQPTSTEIQTLQARPSSKSDRDKIVLDFLHALSSMSESDLDTIVLPTKVLVGLLKGK